MGANLESLEWFTAKINEGKYTLTKDGELFNSRGNPMKKNKVKGGYQWETSTSVKGKVFKKRVMVHRLLYHYFINKIIDPMLQINHIDHNNENNSLDNLELVTASKNCRHEVKDNRHPLAKLNKEAVLEICNLYKSNELNTIKRLELRQKYNITNQSISSIIKGKTYRVYTEGVLF